MIRLLLGLPVRLRRSLLFVAWGAALILLVKTQRAAAFVRPEYGVLLQGAYVLLLLLFVAELFRGREAVRVSSLLAPAILLVPLAFLANAQGVKLDSYALRKRLVGTPALAAGLGGAVSRPGAAAGGETTPAQAASSPGEVSAAAASEPVTVTLTELYRRAQELEGRYVVVTGMSFKSAKVIEDLGADARLVFRFQVACCAADAQPVSVVVLRRPGQREMEDDSWVNVLGRFASRTVNGKRVPVIEEAIVFPEQTPPRNPYLY